MCFSALSRVHKAVQREEEGDSTAICELLLPVLFEEIDENRGTDDCSDNTNGDFRRSEHDSREQIAHDKIGSTGKERSRDEKTMVRSEHHAAGVRYHKSNEANHTAHGNGQAGNE